jgi:hypothetical protein
MSTPPFKSRYSKQRAAVIWLAVALTSAPGALTRAQQTPGELGRLFFTPELRQALDRQRELNISEKQTISENPTLTINGIVTRSSGKNTVWINGIANNEKKSGASVTTNHPGRIIIQTTNAPATKAKVGDTITPNTGEATDLLNGGSITVRRAAPASSTTVR